METAYFELVTLWKDAKKSYKKGLQTECQLTK